MNRRPRCRSLRGSRRDPGRLGALPRVLGALLLLAGCGGRPAQQDTPRTLPSWTCRLGTQGGFTGGGGGFVVHADGRVLSWSRTTATAEVESRFLGIAGDAALATLRQALAAPELATLEWQESGNMTTFLEVLRPDHRRHWSWPAGGRGGATAKVPPAVRRCYEAVHAAAMDAQPSR